MTRIGSRPSHYVMAAAIIVGAVWLVIDVAVTALHGLANAAGHWLGWR